MSELVFVRHGQTEENRTGVLLGQLDPPLNATGREQITAVAVRVAALEPARVFTSPLRRARESAELLAAHCGLHVDVDDRLVEVDYGEYDGWPLADLPADLVHRWRTDVDFAPPGGESLASVQERMARFVGDRLAALDSGVFVAVSHVSPIKAAVCFALGLAPLAAWRMHLDNATLTRLAPGLDAPVLLGFNER